MKQAHIFGGSWTDQKLQILSRYLTAYTTALSKQSFVTGYIDAFAGTGYRENSEAAKSQELAENRRASGIEQMSLLEAEPGESVRHFLDGSARIALQCTPEFDRYVFIEKNADRCLELEQLRNDFPEFAGRISIENGGANRTIQAMCEKDWTRHRAVLFLDPYGAQVRWKTIEAIARTKAIDLWVLFPIGGVNRMLTQSGQIPEPWRHRLNELLGTEEWYDVFYSTELEPSLFAEPVERHVKAGMDVITKFFLKRLTESFAGVAPNPAILRNSKNSPLFVFCFAAGNPKGASLALSIASHILNM